MTSVKILKFGGSSVGNVRRIRSVMEIIAESLTASPSSHVVVSAFQGTTDRLLTAASEAARGAQDWNLLFQSLSTDHLQILHDLIPDQNSDTEKNVRRKLTELENILTGIFLTRELTVRTQDAVMSFGERLSAYILSAALNARGINCSYLDARTVILTDGNFGQARADMKKTGPLIRKLFRKSKEPRIITGFIARTLDGETSTLGRSGSDFTASIFGAALQAEIIEIWTDVDGVMAADPRKVADAITLKSLTYEEAMELSHFGAKVIHPSTMQPALDADIPIMIRNTFNPSAPGTLISRNGLPSERVIKGISSIDSIALINVQGSGMVGVAGIAKRIFTALARKNINVILITQASSEHSICFAVEPKASQEARTELQKELRLELHDKAVSDIQIQKDLSIIAIVGENMKKTPGIAGRIFRTLGTAGINIVAIAQGASELNISIVVSREEEVRALNLLHGVFFRGEQPGYYLFIAGTGVVGSALIRQLNSYSEGSGCFRPGGMINLDKMIFLKGIPSFTEGLERLKTQGVKSDADDFIQTVLTSRSGIFVDCSSGNSFAGRYEDMLAAGVSVVTSNKHAMSAPMDRYRRLADASSRGGGLLRYEANVGAGLPVLSTLRDLRAAGDHFHSIEAVLSGTLSYIFNTLSRNRLFSDVLKEAKASGFTETDPREDLNGLDVARKALILHRELGGTLDLEDIQIEPLLSREFMEAGDAEIFLSTVHGADAHFSEMIAAAADRGEKLRYIASVNSEKIMVGLRSVGPDSPFFGLQETDNMIILRSDYYSPRPLVIQGAGAGANVTAAGVLADIISAADCLQRDIRR